MSKNKRTLKKHIQQVCGNAAVEVLINLPAEVARKIVFQLAELQTRSLANISFSFDHSRRDFPTTKDYNRARTAYNRAAFSKLRKDFDEALQSIVKEINSSLK